MDVEFLVARQHWVGADANRFRRGAPNLPRACPAVCRIARSISAGHAGTVRWIVRARLASGCQHHALPG